MSDYGDRYVPDVGTYKRGVVNIPLPIYSKGYRKEVTKNHTNTGYIILGVVVILTLVMFYSIKSFPAKLLYPALFFFVASWGVRIFAFKEHKKRREIKELALQDHKIPSSSLWNISFIDEDGVATFQGGGYGFLLRFVNGTTNGRSYGQLFEGRSLFTTVLDKVNSFADEVSVVNYSLVKPAGMVGSVETIQANANNTENPGLRNVMQKFAASIEEKTAVTTTIESYLMVQVGGVSKYDVDSLIMEIRLMASSFTASEGRDFYKGVELVYKEDYAEQIEYLFGLSDKFDTVAASFDAAHRDKVSITPVVLKLGNGQKFFLEEESKGSIEVGKRIYE